MAWEHFLSGNLAVEDYLKVENLFSDDEYLETRSFSVLHKTTLGLLPGRKIRSELEASTADIDSQDASGRTCISWAAARGDDESLRILLSFGAQPDIADFEGRSPLQYARNPEVIATLLANGADLNATDNSGRTALHWICRLDGKPAVVEALLNAGININAQDNGGETAICNAAFAYHNEAIAIMLRYNPDLSIGNSSGDTPLRFAIFSNAHEVLRMLLDITTIVDELMGDFLPCKHISGSSLPHVIAQNADLEVLTVLVTKVGGRMTAEQLCAQDKSGNTAEYYMDSRLKGVQSLTERRALKAAFMQLFEEGRVEEVSEELNDDQEEDQFWDAVEAAPIVVG